MAKVIIVDDDPVICEVFYEFITGLSHEVDTAPKLLEGVKMIRDGDYDLVFLDVRLPDGNGLDHIQEIKSADSAPEVIIITGEGSSNGAVLAMENGVWDYVQKPCPLSVIQLVVKRVLKYRQEKSQLRRSAALDRSNIIGDTPHIRECLDKVAQASETNANVSLYGETGTGKELFAQAIHKNSARAHMPFITVDCAALPEMLVESILFGHVKGAFSGAHADREGLVKTANGGTLFLDEVGEIPLPIQAAFLRVLQERRFRPIGGNREEKSDFRLIAATNRDLEQMVQEGKFRSDLLFRLQTILINLPPLRKRTPDILPLAIHLLSECARRHNKGLKGLAPEFVDVLIRYVWPGNVRELANTIESAFAAAKDEPTLYPVHLPVGVRIATAQDAFSDQDMNLAENVFQEQVARQAFPSLKNLTESVEKRYFQDLVAYASGDIKTVCRISGISRANVYSRIKKYGISLNR